MRYVVGDIHGCIDKVVSLVDFFKKRIQPNDRIIFLGDYVDRGRDPFGVIEILIHLKLKYNITFLLGNHEDMFIEYMKNPDKMYYLYMINGGDATIKSYRKRGYIVEDGIDALPPSHKDFLESLNLFYEDDDMIAVHAGLNPRKDSLWDHEKDELIWIREEFIFSKKRYEKKVFFGHTPTIRFLGDAVPLIDRIKNIYGVDTGAVYGGKLTCMCVETLEYWQF